MQEVRRWDLVYVLDIRCAPAAVAYISQKENPKITESTLLIHTAE